jgi:hypothetical protein
MRCRACHVIGLMTCHSGFPQRQANCAFEAILKEAEDRESQRDVKVSTCDVSRLRDVSSSVSAWRKSAGEIL